MLKRYGFFVLALGLAFSTSSLAQQSGGEAVDQQTEGDGQSAGQSSPAPIGFPVRILEDPMEAESAKREQSRAEQREIDDLVAQQRAADAADGAFKVGIAQTILAFFGTAALLYSLYLNRTATNAAVDAVKVSRALGEAELRAYVDFGGMTFLSHWNDANKDEIFWRFNFHLKNVGATPTKRMSVRASMISSEESVAHPEIARDAPLVPLTLGANASASVLTFDLSAAQFQQVKDGQLSIYILIEAKYGNSVNPVSSHITRVALKSGVVTGNPLLYWEAISNPVAISFQHMASMNCVDDECAT